ncbi:MAG: hypothetical protein M1834_004926 [Cirrosporium novae-zelandiae]|nr:MAG: hypothetical protein M1834_004926 [Cirrosporium novae-zelandiae]
MINTAGLYALATILLSTNVASLPENHTDSLVNSVVDSGTFQNPSAQIRPRFRYWVPDASVDPEYLAKDVASAGAVGAGGVEVLGYYLYGGTPEGTGNYSPVDWSVYGWGTPAWRSTLNILAQSHKDNGLIMDFALGPNQGQGVPAPQNSDGLVWELAAFNVSVPVGSSFNGTLPGWEQIYNSTLHAVVTGLVVDAVNTSGISPSLPIAEDYNRTQYTLAADSLEDVTSQVSSDGRISLQFPSNAVGLEYNVFAIYLDHNQYRAQQNPEFMLGPHTTPETWLQNGSWAVDHFSIAGAQTITDFWEQYLLVNGTKELLMSVGNFAWEDSIEIRSNLHWTKDFSDTFEEAHGYDLTKWLPILFHQNKLGFVGEPTDWWITDEHDTGNSHVGDYRETLGELYGLYVKTLNQWAEDYLDLQMSAQISYNYPMDALQNVPNVDAPECESLGFSHLVDGYRQYAGPANLAGKRIISTECGANMYGVYQQTLPSLLWDVKRSIAGSVNTFVLHGYPYSGPYGNTTWPGFSTFDYAFSEMHGDHQPAWDFYSNSMDFIARLSYIFQSGIPKMDLVFWQKFTAYPVIERNYQPTDLEDAGFAYEYLSPDNLGLDEVYVQDGILAPARQAFKALIIRANDSLTVYGVSRLADLAHDGFPIIVSGGIPSYLVSYNESGSAYVNETMASISSLPNVHLVPYDGLASSIASLGINPLTRISSNGSWFTYWRRDDLVGADYVFVYNDGGDLGLGNGYSEGTVEFASTGIPYTYDAFTGMQTPILEYTKMNNSIIIHFSLAGNQSTIVAFLDSPLETSPVPEKHITTTSKGVLGVAYEPEKGLIVKVGPSFSGSFTTSDGLTHSASTPSSQSFTLTNWTLTVERWDPPSNLSAITTQAIKSNTTHLLPTLTSWQEISSLQNVSGRGYYRTTFNWSALNSTGAIIDFGAIVHTIRVSINGQTLPPLDTTWARADIGTYLVQGENVVEAVVSTTLINVLRPIWYDLVTSGTGPSVPAGPAQDYGLLFPVVVTPYAEVIV